MDKDLADSLARAKLLFQIFLYRYFRTRINELIYGRMVTVEIV